MTNANPSHTFLVTGATGYIASWVIKKLLERGYTVHATVRDLNKQSAYQHLTKIAETTTGHLRLFQADLLNEHSFDQAMQGCDTVLHMASPFFIKNYKDAVKDIINPAVIGTQNVLNSVNKIASVQRVVLTSSIVSIFGDAIEIKDTRSQCFDESYWNETSSAEHQPYTYSKVAAEKIAWDMQATQNRWSLVCINPALVLGPSLTPNTQSGSVELLKQFGDGTTLMGVPPYWNGYVDVRDVADAHIQAALNPEAKGRYIISAKSLSLLEIGKILRHKFGYKYPFPLIEVPKILFKPISPIFGYSWKFVELNMGYPIQFNSQKSKDELNIHYRDINTSLTEHFQQLLDDKIVKKFI